MAEIHHFPIVPYVFFFRRLGNHLNLKTVKTLSFFRYVPDVILRKKLFFYSFHSSGLSLRISDSTVQVKWRKQAFLGMAARQYD